MATTAEDHFAAYGEYSRVLRTWFVAYGIGGPVLLFTNDSFVHALKTSGTAKYAARLFLSGVALQILLAALNKVAMWTLYFGEIQGSFKTTRRYSLALRFSEAFWIDLVVDLGTMVLFGLATWRVFTVVTA